MKNPEPQEPLIKVSLVLLAIGMGAGLAVWALFTMGEKALAGNTYQEETCKCRK